MERLPIAFMIAFLLLTMLPVGVRAQDPTETPDPTATIEQTPTATLAIQDIVDLSPDNQLVIQHTITWGDIAVALAVLGLLTFLVVLTIMMLPRIYL